MGKAALDLPDPLLAPPEGARTSTDELLSQLAGEEIDRLLAEADGLRPEGGPPVAASAPVHIAPPAVPEAEVAEEEPHAVFSAPPVAPAPEAAAPVDAAAAQTEADLDVTAELDALFTAATAKDEEEVAAAEAAAAAASVAPATRAADPDETGIEERAALTTVAAAASQVAAPAARVAVAEPVDDAPLPFYLRPLEWLNAPLAMLSPSMRDLVGKAAILTLLNAAAILAYVMFVRRG